ncbi:methyl-accepting chemotaxis protein [Azospirillum picis]|uniref:Methyl-accepting chemotaxis protein n=1 Tax=Azospirillum picis TaxID=488438 RepID=A0ABU0MEN5_9PROT|nr:cache domain-containing protein [Azospirillum picis]MBP2297883.1 methyl-accepting chemotaxis protein [Azospirillum picis]MDQ0531721.1 methyl-accepting chemotaxis protein [Azospirillum picis]
MTGVAAIILSGLQDTQEEASQDKVRSVTEAAIGIVKDYESRVATGELTRDQAQSLARNSLRAMRYSGTEYLYVMEADGKVLVHGGQPQVEGKNLGEAKDPNGVAFMRLQLDAARNGGGFVAYSWPKAGQTEPSPKISYALMSPQWHWMVGSGVYIDNIDADFRRHAIDAGIWGGGLGTLALVLALWLTRSITLPLSRLTTVMSRLADGDLDVAVTDAGRGDEIGRMAKAVDIFKDRAIENRRLRDGQEELRAKAEAERLQLLSSLADGFQRSIGEVVSQVTASAGTMRRTADALNSSTTSAASRSSAAAMAADEAAVSVNTVAGATEELSASIGEIGRQIGASNEVANRAVTEATRANRVMDGLVRAAAEVGDVVSLINSIAGQTNLLALNATIEAARAGEHGKGFAVVASEVKGLANQTARATEDIQKKISEIQQATDVAVAAIHDIDAVIGEITGISGAIAAAVEQQGAATRDISSNVQQAAMGAQAVSSNVAGANEAVADAGGKANEMLDEAGRLSGVADRLRGEVDGFLASIRAA